MYTAQPPWRLHVRFMIPEWFVRYPLLVIASRLNDNGITTSLIEVIIVKLLYGLADTTWCRDVLHARTTLETVERYRDLPPKRLDLLCSFPEKEESELQPGRLR